MSATMEKYLGIKFTTQNTGNYFEVDKRLTRLNKWIHIFGELGLAPVHPEGAYGNHSFRVKENQFVITRTGMIPSEPLVESDYCLVFYKENRDVFITKGHHQPSSECFLHHHIYSSFPHVKVIMHGHSSLLNNYAAQLNIAETVKEHPYGTTELAQAAVDLLNTSNTDFFILKNHGFVCLGDDIETAATLVLDYYGRLLQVLSP